MTFKTNVFFSAALLTSVMLSQPSNAQLLGGDGGLLGTVNEITGSVVSVESGPSSSDSLVNVGIGNGGGDSGNILGVETGNGLDGVADIQLGNKRGGIQAGANVLGLDIDLDLLGNGNGGPAGPGGPGGTNVIVFGGGGSGGAGAGTRFTADCSIDQGRQLLQIASKTKVTPQTWRRAANVQIVPVKLCASTRAQVAKVLEGSGKINQLQGAVASDPLIAASLSRTNYGSDDVFAVANGGGNLTVYVY